MKKDHSIYIYPCFLISLLSLSFLQTGCQPADEKNPARPNILLIMADDQGWGDIHAHGNEIIETPTLDSLGSLSVRFERFYVSPVCAPTRASLLTGRYHLSTGTTWVTRRMEVMREEEVTLAELLKANGYRTGLFGKWHNGSQYPHDPTGQGFDTFFGFSDGHLNNYFDSKLVRNTTPVPTQGYVADLITDEAIRFISDEGSFFCYLAFNTPHSPFQVPDNYFNKYKAKGLDDRTAAIYGMVENMDHNIKRILDALTELDKHRETIVIFLSDNGPNGKRYNGNLKGMKAHVDEGGVRVPFYFHYPAGGLENKVIPFEYFGAHIDVLPTLAELAGIDVPDSLEIHGRSLLPLMKDEEINWADRYFFTHQVARKFDTIPGAVRNHQYALTLTRADTALYDLFSDPFQQYNIAGTKPELMNEFLDQYRNWFLKSTKRGVEPERIQSGHPGIQEVVLPAQECDLYGGISYQGDGWANDWLINWKNASDSAVWHIKSIDSKIYELVLNGSVDAPARFDIMIDDRRFPVEISRPMQAAIIPNMDKVPRTEVEERQWHELAAISVEIPKGGHRIKLIPVKISGVAEVKSISLNAVR